MAGTDLAIIFLRWRKLPEEQIDAIHRALDLPVRSWKGKIQVDVAYHSLE